MGIGVIGVVKIMINEIFGNLVIVIVGFVGIYVLMILVFNMVGCFFWVFMFDYIGRKNIYYCFFVIGMLFYLFILFWVGLGNIMVLIGFYIVIMIIFIMYGGGFVIIFVYLVDLFGILYVGGIYGWLLIVWFIVGVLGLFVIIYLCNMLVENVIVDLVEKVDFVVFVSKFGVLMVDL